MFRLKVCLGSLLMALSVIGFGIAWAEDAGRFSSVLPLPSGQHLEVAEGEREARSIGSFSMRLYRSAGPEDRTTFFLDGLIQSRDGFVESVSLADITGDEKEEIVVQIRAVGSGAYLSAYAYEYDARWLSLVAQVQGLPSDSDVVTELQREIPAD